MRGEGRERDIKVPGWGQSWDRAQLESQRNLNLGTVGVSIPLFRLRVTSAVPLAGIPLANGLTSASLTPGASDLDLVAMLQRHTTTYLTTLYVLGTFSSPAQVLLSMILFFISTHYSLICQTTFGAIPSRKRTVPNNPR